MAVSYRKLWKLLIDRDMKKKDLRITSGISTICQTLACDVGDIMEITNDDNGQPIKKPEGTDYEVR